MKGLIMVIRFHLVLLVLFIGVQACAPISSAPGDAGDGLGISSVPSATPYIAESYPTAEGALISPNQVIGGIEVRVDRAWLEGKQVYADVCYTLPDSSDWTIWKASLKYADIVVLEYGATLVSLQEPGVEGQPGERCDRLEFYVPPDAELSMVTVSVDALAAYPREEDYCTIYMPKIQQALNERGVAITLACNEVDGQPTMQIVGKPETMSQEEAEQLVYSDEFFSITGPWEFSFNLAQ
jgi:hypothetical protein